MEFIPGPDLPTGGTITGLDGIRDAYTKGRGTFRIRATVSIEKLTPRRTGLVVTELPYNVGPEKVISRIKELVQAKKLQGISDLKDLTDRNQGLRLVIELKNGFNPEAVLEELYRLTPMEETFGINNVALVDGEPRTLGLRDLLQVYVDHRLEVVRRRCEHRRAKREERLHLVTGLLVALADIDQVIAVIRDSDDSTQARQRLMDTFDLSDTQARYILDTPLRRLTRYDKQELEQERDTLTAEIAELTAILESDKKLRRLVSKELAAVAKEFATAAHHAAGKRRRSPRSAAGGQRRPVPRAAEHQRPYRTHVGAAVAADVRGAADPQRRHGVQCAGHGARRSRARHRPGPGDPRSRAGAPRTPRQGRRESSDLVRGSCHRVRGTRRRRAVIALASLDSDGPGLVVGTSGIVKRVGGDYPQQKDDFEIIALRPGDRLVGATPGHGKKTWCSSPQRPTARFSATNVRPQGRGAGGVTGIRLAEGAHAVGPARCCRPRTRWSSPSRGQHRPGLPAGNRE